MVGVLQPLFGAIVILCIAVLCSTNRRAINWSTVAWGLSLQVIFALIVGPGWLAAPTVLPALVFGLATVAFGWFLLQPGLGMGWAAARTPNPTRVRLLNLAGHAVFGTGLWLTGLLIG